MKIEYHNTFRRCCHFSGKMPFYPEKWQKGAKVGGAVGQNKLFCILLKIDSFDFFDILHNVRDHQGVKLTATHFLGKCSFWPFFLHLFGLFFCTFLAEKYTFLYTVFGPTFQA